MTYYDPRAVIEIAAAEVGYLEKSAAAYRADPDIIYSKTGGAGSDNITKFNVELHKLYPEVMDISYWCDSFVDWCFMQAYGVANARKLLAGDFDDYTVNSAALYKGKNAWKPAGTVPQPGWQIFFTNGKRICHTGLVKEYLPSSSTIVTIEGNTSGASGVISNGGGVCIKQYGLNNSRIAGFGVPPFGKKQEFTPHWVHSGDTWYYRVAEGINAHGWRMVDSHWYYFDEESGAMQTGLQKIGSDYYFLTTREIDAGHEGACMQTGSGGNLREWQV